MSKYGFRACLCLVGIILANTPAYAVIRNVPADYPTIQYAIVAAVNTDEIVVSAGHYYENLNFLGKAITVRSTDPENPAVQAATILDGSLCADPNNSVVTFNHGEGNNSILKGFTITGGTGTWLPIAWRFHEVYWNRCGGGVVCYNLSAPTISYNIFLNNLAGQGGGVYVYGDPVNPDNPQDPPVHLAPVISNNRFENNHAIVLHGFPPPNEQYSWGDHGDGGAYVGFQGVDAILENNQMINNFADNYGGAVHLRQWCNGELQTNTIQNCHSTLGAGLHITYQSAPVIEKNTIDGNSATNLGGGGIYIYYESHPTVRWNTIKNNSSTSGAGICVYYSSYPLIENNMIIQNQTGEGILCKGSDPVIRFNTIAANSASSTSGGIRCESSDSALIENNIICRNGAGYGIYVLPDSAPGSLEVRYNLIYGHPMGHYNAAFPPPPPQDGNIYVDPSFLNESGGDFHIALNSPCVSAADPAYIPATGTADYDGDNRKLGERSDIGADEIMPVAIFDKDYEFISNFETIQISINNANDSNIIEVARGHYTEQISFGTKQIILRSTNPQDWNTVYATVIDANRAGTAVLICGGQTSQTRFEGFTVTGGLATNDHAGGMYCTASPLILNNYFVDNNAAEYKGGGLYFYGSACVAIARENRIIQNMAKYGAGVFCDTASKVTLENNWIAQNAAISAAGGISISYAHPDTMIRYNYIVANTANLGGGVYLTASPVWFWNNQILGNTALIRGGGLILDNTNTWILQNTILENRAPQGAGIYSGWFISPTISNNIIAFNLQGEGVYDELDDQPPVLSHNDLYDNAGGNYTGDLPDPIGQNGNISADPNIALRGVWYDNGTPDLLDDTYQPANVHLLPGSPCINAGDTAAVPTGLTEDIDGESRILFGDVEIGADEIDPTVNPADINVDGIVDSNDMTLLLDDWLRTGSGLPGDITGDQTVNLSDWTILVENWLWEAYWHIP